jgi:hypothetical protein
MAAKRSSEAGWFTDIKRFYRSRDLSAFGIADSDTMFDVLSDGLVHQVYAISVASRR